MENIYSMMDYTNLKPYLTDEELVSFLDTAKQLKVHMVAINSCNTKFCKDYLYNTNVKVGAAIGFPLGQTSIDTKLFETFDAIKNGCDEIDYVINIGKLESEDYDYVETEMSRIVSLCRENNVCVKVIFENCYLSDDEKIKMCKIANKVKPDFIKTSTGFGSGGAIIEDIKLMRKYANKDIQIKAAGGISDYQSALEMIEAGATRIGTSKTLSK